MADQDDRHAVLLGVAPAAAPRPRGPGRPSRPGPRARPSSASGSSRRRAAPARSPRPRRRCARRSVSARTSIASPAPRRRRARAGPRAGAAAPPTPRPRHTARGRVPPVRVARCRAAIASTSVDLPMPGSPPSSTSEPGTRPPPSTRSTSPMPTRDAVAAAVVELAERRHAVARRPVRRCRVSRRTSAGCTTRLDQRVPGAARAALAFPAQARRAARADRRSGSRAAPLALGAASTGVFSVERLDGQAGVVDLSTTTVCPAVKRPSSSASASGSSTMFWITRRSGRAP